MNRSILAFLALILLTNPGTCEEFRISSPAGNITVTIKVADSITYTVEFKGKTVLHPSSVSLKPDTGAEWGVFAKLTDSKTGQKINTISPVVPRKFREIEAKYNFLLLTFKGEYQLEYRVYDDGMAYRWNYMSAEDFKVVSENVNFIFSKGDSIYFPEEESLHSHQERLYQHIDISQIESGRFCSTGALAVLQNGVKVYISEADLFSYPGMYLEKSDDSGFKGKFSGYPLETLQTNDRNVKVAKYADYIAKVEGPRSLPWRLMIVSEEDAELVQSELVYKLASPNRLSDVLWIRPGKVAWDWWNANNIYGVDFVSGVNDDTYKYYIDFASKYGLEYIILDEGWYYLEDVMKVREEIDIPELVGYGNSRNVGIILWVTWKALDDKLDEALHQFESWGVKGIKVDFMQRDDQWMVEYYERIAIKAAEHKLLVDFHGAYKPTGLNVTYPNVMTSEGVFGLEQCKWTDKADPEHNVTLPFTRMVAGPMDYTPGAMKNANKKNFRYVFTEPMSPSTRCHQLAMYVVYESPLQMLADNPSNYLKEPECMEFLSTVPVTWDETRVLKAQVADYVVIARKKGDDWFMGAMTDWTARDFELSMEFLSEGTYFMEIWQDGVNADKHASDYKKVSFEVSRNSKVNIHLAPGGGWVAVLKKV